MKTSEEFDGRSAEMKKDSPWLATEDLVGLGDVSVEIMKVYKHSDVEFDQGRKEKAVYSIEFKGKKKQLVLNTVNRKTIVRQFGVNVKDWAGKTVKLYVDPKVTMMGKVVGGIRIREGK